MRIGDKIIAIEARKFNAFTQLVIKIFVKTKTAAVKATVFVGLGEKI